MVFLAKRLKADFQTLSFKVTLKFMGWHVRDLEFKGVMARVRDLIQRMIINLKMNEIEIRR